MVDFLRKRLQIFVSSTFTDLQSERQAAVEAILVAGHIPAGMELFTAGDESQMTVIRQWIDESDVYLLILGGRYGSIDPATGKSYTHLEYDYAVESGKPTFALVVTEDGLDLLVKDRGKMVIEADNPQGLKNLRAHATGKLVRFWTDKKDIRIAIGETLSAFARRDELKGWVRPQDQTSVPLLAGEVARLSKENSDLRDRLANLGNQTQPLGIGYQGVLRVLEARELLIPFTENIERLLHRSGALENEHPSFLVLLELGLVERREESKARLTVSESGKAFLNWLKLKNLESNSGDAR